MKKVLCVILTLIFVFALSACGGATGNTKETTLLTELITIGTKATSTQTTSAETTVAQTSQPQTTDNAEPVEVEMLPEEIPTEFTFASGAGAWCTFLLLEHDGSFKGSYHDSEMGSNAEEYPKGTCYVCEFSGKFDNIVKINDYCYSMILTEITTENEYGEEWIKNEVRYIASNPYGIHNGEEFILYLPGTPVSELSEKFKSWSPFLRGDDAPDTMSDYGICNVNTGHGFFG